MAFMNKLSLGFIIIFVVIAIVSTMNTIDNKDALREQFQLEPEKSTAGLALFAVGMDVITPAHQSQWLPFQKDENITSGNYTIEKYTFLLEDKPYVDSKDFFIIGIILVVGLSLFFWLMRNNPIWAKLLLAVPVTMILFFIGYVLSKLIAYGLMLTGADMIGISKDQALIIRQQIINQYNEKNISYWNLALSALIGLTILKFVIGVFKKKEK